MVDDPASHLPRHMHNWNMVGRLEPGVTLEEARARDRRTLMLVRGETGAGASLLASTFAERAGRDGAGVVRTRAREMERGTPYYPWREVLRAILGSGARSTREVEARLAGLKLGLVPIDVSRIELRSANGRVGHPFENCSLWRKA